MASCSRTACASSRAAPTSPHASSASRAISSREEAAWACSSARPEMPAARSRSALERRRVRVSQVAASASRTSSSPRTCSARSVSLSDSAPFTIPTTLCCALTPPSRTSLPSVPWLRAGLFEGDKNSWRTSPSRCDARACLAPPSAETARPSRGTPCSSLPHRTDFATGRFAAGAERSGAPEAASCNREPSLSLGACCAALTLSHGMGRPTWTSSTGGGAEVVNVSPAAFPAPARPPPGAGPTRQLAPRASHAPFWGAASSSRATVTRVLTRAPGPHHFRTISTSSEAARGAEALRPWRGGAFSWPTARARREDADDSTSASSRASSPPLRSSPDTSTAATAAISMGACTAPPAPGHTTCPPLLGLLSRQSVRTVTVCAVVPSRDFSRLRRSLDPFSSTSRTSLSRSTRSCTGLSPPRTPPSFFCGPLLGAIKRSFTNPSSLRSYWLTVRKIGVLASFSLVATLAAMRSRSSEASRGTMPIRPNSPSSPISAYVFPAPAVPSATMQPPAPEKTASAKPLPKERYNSAWLVWAR
ncbi:hypothetical protein T484DRAFT_1955731 [Baffinella frigidus]|nr:hypothetical protein T484DRAFT_1955731 [Cryptophyta sp. CCMP2293]